MAGRLRTVFFGSSDFSVPSLLRLIADQDIIAVCSQPDKPAGRGLTLTPTPVAKLARETRLPLLTPKRLDDTFIAQLASLHPELLACASYGKILPAKLLDIEGMTSLNVHPSLLPKYRGATPIQTALRDGCDQTGVTVFWMDAGMDDGDIALSRRVKIDPSDNYGSLHDKLARAGSDLLGEAAQRLREGDLPRSSQDAAAATYTKPLTKEDVRLRLDAQARDVVNQIRSLCPKPGGWMTFNGKRLKVLEADVVSQIYLRPENAKPGDLLGWAELGPVVATSPGAICLIRVIPEGKPVMSGAEFAKRTKRAG